MQITIRLLASYRRYLPPGHDEQDGYSQDVAPGTSAGEVLTGLPLLPDDITTLLVNGRHAERSQVLQAGDILTVFPPAGGG